jgi:RND family efflux transporter MFP subunit
VFKLKLTFTCAVLVLLLMVIPYQIYSEKRSPNSVSKNNKIRVVLDPNQRTVLSAEISSPIVKITKKMGESFEVNDLLIQLENTITEAYYEENIANLNRAEAQHETRKQLFLDGASSLIELKEAEADLAKARADLVLSKYNFEACTVTAPYKGKVIALAYDQFELTEKGKPLIEIIDDTTLIVKFIVKSDQLDKLYVGKSLDIIVLETNTVEKGTIIRVNAMIDPLSSTIKVEAEIDNSDAHLKAGMIGVTTLIETEQKKKL